MNVLIVGSGLSGAVLANRLAKVNNLKIHVIDKRDHLGGNCYTYRDEGTGVIVHKYGPHIFNTNELSIYEFFQQLVTIKPYVHRVKSVIDSQGVFDVPVNLHVINQFFGKNFGPAEAAEFVKNKALKITSPANFEEQALTLVGPELYEAFFKGYTIKQWGVHPKELPASIARRLPVRFNYDSNYHKARYTGIPEFGYTPIFEKLLDNPSINLSLNTLFSGDMRRDYDHVFYSGPLDEFYHYDEGRLGYRTVYWEHQIDEGDFQGISQINYPDMSVPYTRIIEHKYFMPWATYQKTFYSREFSKETEINDEPYYPKRLAVDHEILGKYIERATADSKITFMGRLGTYRYIDMWKATQESLELGDAVVEAIRAGRDFPVFSVPPR